MAFAKRCVVGVLCVFVGLGWWGHAATAQQAAFNRAPPGTNAVPCLTHAECLRQLRFAETALLRQQAAQILGERGVVSANQALVTALQNDPSEFVKIKAAQALGRLRAPSSFEPLVNALTNSQSDTLRVTAALALGAAQMVEATPSLTNALRRDPQWQVRRAAVLALGHFNQRQHLPILLGALQNEPHPLVRLRIVTNLQKITFSKTQALNTAPVLIKVFKAEKNTTVRAAIIALQGVVGDKKSQQALRALLTHKQVSVREAVAQALGGLQDRDATQSLIQTLRDDADLRVRQAALRALSKHTSVLAQEAVAYYATHSKLKDLRNLAKDLLQNTKKGT